MKQVHVAAGKPYDVLMAGGLISQCGERIRAVLGRTCKAAILTDDIVDALYGEQTACHLQRAGFEVCKYSMPHGEGNKNLTQWSGMLNFLAENHLTRADLVVALGGGVVGDMAGFAAASYLRGIPFVQMPTSLLSMVDSSVGGKTGVNLDVGKNLVGAFYQPILVLCDTDTLQTLQPERRTDGVAEIMKYAMLGDTEMFELLSDGRWDAHLDSMIETCVAAKARLVAADERDTGSRQLLNLGHTLGHAIEKCSGFAITHGHAVAIGMVYAARLSEKLGLCDAAVRMRLMDALAANNLPISAPYAAEKLCAVALSDKKRTGGQITFVLPRQIGHCELKKLDVADLPRLVALAVEEG